VTSEVFQYHRCIACGLLFLWPVPEVLGNYYPENYYNVPDRMEDLRPEAEAQRHKLQLVRRYVAGGRLLEIGPAYGAFVLLAKEAGYSVSVIEMDGRCCSFLEEELGVRATMSDEPQVAIEGLGSYNVIALWQVVEHLRDPWSLLKVAPAHLEPGGVLVLSSPNPDALQMRIFGRLWTHIDAPRHLQLIPIGLLERLSIEVGLKVLEVSTADREAAGWNVFGWQFTLQNMVKGRLLRRAMRELGKKVGAIAGPLEFTHHMGSTYTAVLQRERR
jgi:SAM-dependent methyltransferase